ncbi:MAG: exo-alpha-sialidase [Acidimicrobiales bacterium]
MGDLLVGTRKGLFEISRTESGYSVGEPAFLAVPVTAVLHDRRDGTTYAGLDHGHYGIKLQRRDDDGAVWEELDAPTYPTKPEGTVDVDPNRKDDVPWATQMIWSLEAAHPDRPGALWAGTIPGGLFRSPDRGGSWELVRSLWDEPSRVEWFGGGYDHPGMHSVCVDPRSADALLVGISCGGAWRSDDDGATWTVATGMRAAFMPPDQAYNPVVQDPHRLVRCAAAPDVVWCQHHNGVFRSVDGGATFTEITDIEPSTFGFGVAVHPGDADTAWLAPAIADEARVPVDGRLVVTRTRDGGASWEALGRGLPDRDAYHLVYRHALDVDSTGERLALASTTGSLWISEDAADSWSLVSADLPPIACVRWTT